MLLLKTWLSMAILSESSEFKLSVICLGPRWMSTLPESWFSRKYFDDPISINFQSPALEDKDEQPYQTINHQLHNDN